MTAIAGNHELKSRLARVLGLDPKKVSGMTIYIIPNEVVKVVITRSIYDNELEDLIMELKDYKLVEKEKHEKKT